MPRKRLKKRPSVSSSCNISDTTRVRRSRSNSQVCKCLVVWSLVCSLIFLQLSVSILEQGLCYLSFEFRLLLLAENMYASTICETGVRKTQKIKHKGCFSLLSDLPWKVHSWAQKSLSKWFLRELVLTSYSTNHWRKNERREARQGLRCYLAIKASHYLPHSVTILSA